FTGATVLPGRVVGVRDGLRHVALEGGLTLWSADEGDGEVNVAIYPWDVSLGSSTPDDSRMNHVSAAVVSIAPMGNRTRVRVGPIVAEITAASAERLDLRPGVLASASISAVTAFAIGFVKRTSSWIACTCSADPLRSAVASSFPTRRSSWRIGSAK